MQIEGLELPKTATGGNRYRRIFPRGVIRVLSPASNRPFCATLDQDIVLNLVNLKRLPNRPTHCCLKNTGEPSMILRQKATPTSNGLAAKKPIPAPRISNKRFESGSMLIFLNAYPFHRVTFNRLFCDELRGYLNHTVFRSGNR